VGRDILVDILDAMGAEVVVLGRSETFIPVDTEAVRAEDIDLARRWAGEHRLDAIASTDGDSDRPLLADHEGEWLRGDVLGVLCAQAVGAQSVVTPVSSNTLVEKCGAFGAVHRTRIGSPYVIAAMAAALSAKEGVVGGYEANGGFLLASDVTHAGQTLSALPTRDAVLPIVAALAAARPGRLADLVADLPPRTTFSDRLADFAPARRDALFEWMKQGATDARMAQLGGCLEGVAGAVLTDIDDLDGVRMSFANGRIIHLRGSGNAPELRCYAEAETKPLAESLSRQALDWVAQRFPA
jgi:phosphomannomutase